MGVFEEGISAERKEIIYTYKLLAITGLTCTLE